MPPPRITTRVPLPSTSRSGPVSLTAWGMASNPSDCIRTKAALYPPVWPARIRNSRRVRLILFTFLEIGVQGVSTYTDEQRCGRKSGQTRRNPKAVAASQSRTRTKYGRIFARNPEGRRHFSSFRRHSSLGDTRYPSLLIPRTEEKWLPSLPPVYVDTPLKRGTG